MTNELEAEDIEWRFVHSMAFRTYHHSKFINEEYGLQMEQITNVKANSEFGKAKTYYFISGQEKEYTDLQEMIKDWNEIKNFDDPNNEIIWEKRIVPIIKLKDGSRKL